MPRQSRQMPKTKMPRGDKVAFLPKTVTCDEMSSGQGVSGRAVDRKQKQQAEKKGEGWAERARRAVSGKGRGCRDKTPARRGKKNGKREKTQRSRARRHSGGREGRQDNSAIYAMKTIRTCFAYDDGVVFGDLSSADDEALKLFYQSD